MNELAFYTIIGNFSPTVLCILRSLSKYKKSVGFIQIGDASCYIPKLNYVSAVALLKNNCLFAKKGIHLIKDFLSRYQADAIISINENISCWLIENRTSLPENTKILSPSLDVIKRVLSKKQQIEVAQKAGLTVLPTYFIEDKSSNGKLEIFDHHFPLCLRPSEPNAIIPSFKVRIVNNKAELKNAIDSLSIINKPLIAQPFMDMPNLVVHGSRSISAQTFGLQGFIVKRKFEGLTLTIKPIELEQDFIDRCIAFTDIFGITGPYHFEFLYEKKTKNAFFLELNSRFGGTTAKVFACGYDEALYALKSYGIDGNIKKSPKLRKVTASSKVALLKYLSYTISNKITPFDFPRESKLLRIMKALWGIIYYNDDVFSFKDLQGTLAYYLATIKENFVIGKEKTII